MQSRNTDAEGKAYIIEMRRQMEEDDPFFEGMDLEQQDVHELQSAIELTSGGGGNSSIRVMKNSLLLKKHSPSQRQVSKVNRLSKMRNEEEVDEDNWKYQNTKSRISSTICPNQLSELSCIPISSPKSPLASVLQNRQLSYMVQDKFWRQQSDTINSLILTGKTFNPCELTSRLKNAMNSMSTARKSPYYEGTDIVI